MSVKWTPEEEHLLRILRPTNTIVEIGVEFAKRFEKGIRGFRTERSIDAIRRKCDRDEITPESTEKYGAENEVIKQWDVIKEVQKLYKEEALFRSRGILNPEDVTTKILSVSDIHFPLANEELLTKIVEEHQDANICVVNGDLIEGYIYSTFDKKRSIAGHHEYICAFSFIKTLSEIFPEVVIVDGNHDVRISRALKDAGFTKDASQVLRPNLIARMANGEMLDETGMLVDKLNFSNVHYQGSESWYVRIGKTIFAHPHGRLASAPGSGAQKCNQYFRERYSSEDYDSIIVGHTHKIYKGVINGRLLVEQGCLTDLLGYSHEPKMSYINNAQNGFAVVYQDDDGNTDFNLSGPIYLGEVMPPKKALAL